jgi:hypothetical protein
MTTPENPPPLPVPSTDLQMAATIIGSLLNQSAQTQADTANRQGITAIELERIKTERFNKTANHSLIIWLGIFIFICGTMITAFATQQYQIATHLLTAGLGALAGYGAKGMKSQ